MGEEALEDEDNINGEVKYEQFFSAMTKQMEKHRSNPIEDMRCGFTLFDDD